MADPTVQGVRLPDGTWFTKRGPWKVGEYCLDEDKGKVWIQLPYKDQGAPVHIPTQHAAPEVGGPRWTLTEHDDGTLSLDPSIHAHEVWHGYLRHGVLEGV